MTSLDKKLIIILIVSATLLFGFRYLPTAQAGLWAEIAINGQSIEKINLHEAEGKVVQLKIPRGIAELEVADGAVRLLEMSDALCPRKICSHTGWIKRPGETIVCVPNQLVIRLTSQTKTDTIDAVTK